MGSITMAARETHHHRIHAGRTGHMSRGAVIAAGALDDLLGTLQSGNLSPMELRMLLHLVERETTPLELADGLHDEPDAIASATRRLARRGLIRQRFDEDGRRSRFVLSITVAGLLALGPLSEWIPDLPAAAGSTRAAG